VRTGHLLTWNDDDDDDDNNEAEEPRAELGDSIPSPLLQYPRTGRNDARWVVLSVSNEFNQCNVASNAPRLFCFPLLILIYNAIQTNPSQNASNERTNDPNQSNQPYEYSTAFKETLPVRRKSTAMPCHAAEKVNDAVARLAPRTCDSRGNK